MKAKMFTVIFATVSIILFGTGIFGFTQQTHIAPSAFIPNSRYTFSPVLDGAQITHGFVIQNKGDATLEIEKVRPG